MTGFQRYWCMSSLVAGLFHEPSVRRSGAAYHEAGEEVETGNAESRAVTSEDMV